MTAWIAMVVVIPLVLTETGELAPWLSARCIRFGARMLSSTRARERFVEEWCAGLERVPGKLTKLCFAAGIVLVAVPMLRVMDWRAEREVPGMRAACERGAAALEGATDLQALAELLAGGAVASLGFRDVAIGFRQPGSYISILATAGRPGLRETLVGAELTQAQFEAMLMPAEDWGTLRFLPDIPMELGMPVFTPPPPLDPPRTPDAWNRDNGLVAPLYDQDGAILGKISLDEPLSGRCPGPAQRSILEMYAAHAARRAATIVTGVPNGS